MLIILLAAAVVYHYSHVGLLIVVVVVVVVVLLYSAIRTSSMMEKWLCYSDAATAATPNIGCSLPFRQYPATQAFTAAAVAATPRLLPPATVAERE